MYGPRMYFGPLEPGEGKTVDDEDLTVDPELLRRVKDDPDWTHRVLVAAARALNTLAFYSDDQVAQRRDFRHPHAEAIPARQMLFDAFITEPQMAAARLHD